MIELKSSKLFQNSFKVNLPTIKKRNVISDQSEHLLSSIVIRDVYHIQILSDNQQFVCSYCDDVSLCRNKDTLC